MNHLFCDCKQVETVSSFFDLISTSFHDEKNAICWERDLAGDFKEIVTKLQLKDNITEISIEDLNHLVLSKKGIVAKTIILNDLMNLMAVGAMPSLNLVKNYNRDDEFEFISTDVYSFHVDRSSIGTDTYLCTYYGAVSDIIPNDEVEQKISIPKIRSKLKSLHDGIEEDFDSFLKSNYFDLHYQPKTNAQPINLGLGNLWKLAVDHPTQNVLPCVHRAPIENDYRLLLIC